MKKALEAREAASSGAPEKVDFSQMSPNYMSETNAFGGSKSQKDSEKRGYVLLALVLLANVWSFTIPVELRRARICTDPNARGADMVKVTAVDTGCMTSDQWNKKLKEFYSTCGQTKSCIEFNFDVAGKT